MRLGRIIKVSSVVAMVLAPLPNLYIFMKTVKPGPMPPEVLSDYKVIGGYMIWVMALVFLLGVFGFIAGKRMTK